MPSASPFLPSQAPATPPARLFARAEHPRLDHSIQHVVIDRDRLVAKRPPAFETVPVISCDLLKPEVLGLQTAEKDPSYCVILDLMWSTGIRGTGADAGLLRRQRHSFVRERNRGVRPGSLRIPSCAPPIFFIARLAP